MGFNTTVVVLNDALHYIEEDKDFGKNLVEVIQGINIPGRRDYVPAGCHANAASVIETHHADSNHLVMVGGNIGKDLGYVGGYRLDTETDEGKRNLIRNLAFGLGYEVAIKPKKRPRGEGR